MRSIIRPVLAAFGCAVVLASCGDDDTYFGPEVAGFDVEVLADGLGAPTQVASGDGFFVVAVLNGGENDRVGQVILIDPNQSEPVVLQESLNKPTGVAVLGDELWIMEQRRLSVTSLEPGAELRVIADELPFNGRSEGTLTVMGDQILFNTSGRISDGQVVEGSGRLFSVTSSIEPVEVASGFKNAYGHVIGPDGEIWVGEVSDGTFDGEAAADELIRVVPGTDHGWPFCVGDNRAVSQFGGTEASCDEVDRPLAVFEPGATPTSVALAPWDDSKLLAVLWTERRIVEIDLSGGGAGEPSSVETLVDVFDRPMHLLADGDRLLVTDLESGQLLALTPS